MTPWEDAEEILVLVQDEKNWSQSLFERCRNNTLVSPCIYNQIRKILSPEQYTRFDDAYSFTLQPKQRAVVEYIRRERRKKGGRKEHWKRKESLHQKSDKQLLSLLSQLKKENLL